MNAFEIFGIEPNFHIDENILDTNYYKLQKQYHPDLFVNKSLEERKEAEKKSSELNQCYKELKDPLNRARILLQIKSNNYIFEANDSIISAMFMIREELEEATSPEEIQVIKQRTKTQIKENYDKFDNFIKKMELQKAHDTIELITFLVSIYKDICEREV